MLGSYDQYKYIGNMAATAGDRWAREEELKGVLHHQRLSSPFSVFHGGLPVISDGDEMYVDDQDTHNLIIGSTGSKKTRLFVMPMLETFRRAKESVVVSDPKGELYDLTAQKFSDAGFKVYTLNLRDPAHSDCWNPLYLARKFYKQGNFDQAASVVNDFAASMIQEKGRTVDPFWQQTSRSMLRGLIMMMVENEKVFTDDMVSIANLRVLSQYIRDDNEDPGLTYQAVCKYPNGSLAKSNLDSVVRGSGKTFSNICVSYDAEVQDLYVQNSLVQMLSGNNIDFTELGRSKTILFIIMPDEKTTLHRMVSLMVKQCYTQLIDMAQSNAHNHLTQRVNFLLDEFSNLPCIPDMNAMISAARSRNIRFHLVIQGLLQLQDKYGMETAQTIKGNCNNWVFLTSRELVLLREISDLCGTRADGYPLITTTQLQHLKKENGEALILLGREFPYIAHMPDISEYRGFDQPPKILPLPESKVSGQKIITQNDIRMMLPPAEHHSSTDFDYF